MTETRERDHDTETVPTVSGVHGGDTFPANGDSVPTVPGVPTEAWGQVSPVDGDTGDTDPHIEALARVSTKIAAIRYAVDVLDGAPPADVIAWLKRYGIVVSRSKVSPEVKAWKERHGLTEETVTDQGGSSARDTGGDASPRGGDTVPTVPTAPAGHQDRPHIDQGHDDRNQAMTSDFDRSYRTADLPRLTPDLEAELEAELSAAMAAPTVDGDASPRGGDTVPTVPTVPRGHRGQLAGIDGDTTDTVPTVPTPVAEVSPTNLATNGDTNPSHGDTVPTVPAAVPAAVPASVGTVPAGGGTEARKPGQLVVWPVLLMALSAFVAVWSGWVGLGEMTGFGEVKPLPGIADSFTINSAITLPIGVEAYAAYAMYVWLSGRCRVNSHRVFAKWSSIGALLLGAAGQVAYHLLEQSQAGKKSEAQAIADAAAAAAGHEAPEVVAVAPWWITTFVSCLPVIVVGLGAALAHMVLSERDLAAE